MHVRTWRTLVPTQVSLLLGLTAILLTATAVMAQENLFSNADFEAISGDKGYPTGWLPLDFGTGGMFAVGDDGGQSGERYAIVKGAEVTHRSCWRQQVLWSDENEGVTVTGWYRTRDVATLAQKGASIRFLFNDDPNVWHHLRISTAWYEPAEEWTQLKTTFPVPKGTRAVVVELFHWFTSGQTHWDNMAIRPATADELAQASIDPSIKPDREPVYGQNLPYSPADGETVKLNPPPFRWLPSGADATYQLQISRTEDFKGDGLIAFRGSAWCAEMLTEPLAEGDWHWRYGVDREGLPTLWSKSRRFTVTGDADPWPYPGRDALQVPAQRPHLFLKPERLAELRKRAQGGDLKSTADGLVRATRSWAGEELIAEPEWLPKDPDERREAYGTYIQTTRRPMDRMEEAALAYLLTGDAGAGAEAKRRILYFFGWDPSGPTNVFHNDEPAMWIMMRGVRSYDWTYDLFTEEERAGVEASMRIRAADFYKKMRAKPFENNPFESHAGRIIGFLGEAAIEFLNDWPEAREWLDYITKIYWGVYPAWGKDDGGWNEGPGYWGAYMSFALHFVVALREGTGVDLSKRPFFHNTPYYRLYITPPHSQMSPFGDGTQWLPSLPGTLMYWFSTLAQDPAIRWYTEKLNQNSGSSILGIVLKDDNLRGRAPYELPPARLFEGVGLASLHTDLVNGDDDVHLAMRASPYGAVSHGHQDQNCFVLEAYGEALAISSGHYNSYGSPHHAQWTRETKAKCGITFDGGKGQDRGWHAQGKISDFVHGEGLDLLVGDATAAYGGRLTRAVREVVHIRPGIFVIRDDLASDEPRTFEYQLHAIDEMSVNEEGNAVIIKRPKASLTTRFLEPKSLAFTQTDQFDPPPTWPADRKFENNWHLTASMTEPVKQTEFLTVLLPARTGDEAELPQVREITSPSARGASLEHPNGANDIVCFAAPGANADMQIAGVTTDARMFALTQNADSTEKAYLIRGGTRLSGAGTQLVRCDKPMNITVYWSADGGRIDSEGPGGRVAVRWPSAPVALTRDGERVVSTFRDSLCEVELKPGRDSIVIWHSEPAPTGDASVDIKVGAKTIQATGMRYGRGRTAVTAVLDVQPGAYRARLPEGVELATGAPVADGLMWLTRNASVSFSGTNLPASVSLEPVKLAAELPARLQTDMPGGITYEAEKNWSEQGGSISVSGGGHKNTSGGDNLWAWNTVGHTLLWDIDVAQAGCYEVWFVGSTETGLLTDFSIDGGESLALWFSPTGGWGRTAAKEWRAFQVRKPDGSPATFDLSAGKHKLALGNWMGMGLNIDRIVLVPKG